MKLILENWNGFLNENQENLYSIFELTPTDNIDMIKKAYIAKAKNAGSNEDVRQKLANAYETLLDPEEKQEYDKKLYADAVSFKKQRPDARFNANNGLPLDDQTMKKLKDMAGTKMSSTMKQRSSDVKASFDPDTGMPLSAEAMSKLIKNDPERIKTDIMPLAQKVINNIKNDYGNPVAMMLVSAFQVADNKGEILFALMQASQKNK